MNSDQESPPVKTCSSPGPQDEPGSFPRSISEKEILCICTPCDIRVHGVAGLLASNCFLHGNASFRGQLQCSTGNCNP